MGKSSSASEAALARGQRGQALVYGLFLLALGSASLYFLFNAGQVTREKTQVTNAADAAAFSGATLQARGLNFVAYTNRAEVANTVAIAQMTALLSWNEYVQTMAVSYGRQSPSSDEICWRFCLTGHGATPLPMTYGGNAALEAYTGVDLFELYRETIAPVVEKGAKALAKNSDRAIQVVLRPAAVAVFAAMPAARDRLVQDVVSHNFEGAGHASGRIQTAVEDSWLNYGGAPAVRFYDGADRERLALIADGAVQRDGFTRERNWSRSTILPNCVDLGGLHHDALRRRGGTKRQGLDEWEAVDTVSWHQKYMRKGDCKTREKPLAYGSANAGDDPDIEGGGGGGVFSRLFAGLFVRPTPAFGGASGTNRRAFGMAVDGNTVDFGYSGIPSFFDLGSQALAAEDPRLRLGVRVLREQSHLRTSNASGQNQLAASARLGFLGTPSSRAMAAVSSAEIFFERPQARGDGRQELGSLFNPFWQVRLVEPSSAAIAAAVAAQ